MKKYINIIIVAIYSVNYISNPERKIKGFINENSKELVILRNHI